MSQGTRVLSWSHSSNVEKAEGPGASPLGRLTLPPRAVILASRVPRRTQPGSMRPDTVEARAVSTPLGQVPGPWKPPCLVVKHTLNTTTQCLLFVRSKAEHPRLPRRPDVHTRKPPVTAARSHGGRSRCRSCPPSRHTPGCRARSCRKATQRPDSSPSAATDGL